MAGYLVLGTGFGILMNNYNYSVLMTFLMSVCIFAGSMQYIGVGLLASGASIITTALTTIMVNARHLFYSISMIEKYKDTYPYKPYLIFGLTDETYSLLCDVKIPENIDKNLFLFLTTLFNQIYWVIGSVFGNVIGDVIPFSTAGIEFSMTALFVSSFTEQWITYKNHTPAIAGIISTTICLIIFGKEKFLIPSMVLITIILTLLHNNQEEQYA